VALEARGIPTVTICSSQFEVLGRREAMAAGMPDLALAVVPHPIGGLEAGEARARAEAAFDGVLRGLGLAP
jgi:hypothetical protein